MNRLIPIAAAGLLALGGATLWQSMQSGPETSFELPGMAVAQTTEADAEAPEVMEMALGAEDAPLTIIEYASFTCPHCKNFHKGAFQQIKSDYIDTGKVRFVYREVYFDRFGLWAGMVARCGGPERYFGIADMIYDQQAEWTAGGDPATIAENLRTIGRTAGLTTDELDACLTDADKAQAMIAVFEANAEADGVRSTPTFVIDGEVVTGNQNFEDFAEIIDGKLGE